jgi:hypothetical protein
MGQHVQATNKGENMDLRQLETCTLTIIDNNGDKALANVFIDGEMVDIAEFDRDDETKEYFTKISFPIGATRIGSRAITTKREFQALKNGARASRVQ